MGVIIYAKKEKTRTKQKGKINTKIHRKANNDTRVSTFSKRNWKSSRIIKRLEEKGYIKRQDKKGRTLRLLKGGSGEIKKTSSKDFYTQKELVEVPVIGKITAGEPILAVENVTDTFPIPIDFVGNSESFMLTVRGESMIEAGILDGDYILVKKQNTANNGEIVVALIEDEATVKTFYKEKDHIRLQPENSTMDPIIVANCEILGKVAGVFRKM